MQFRADGKIPFSRLDTVTPSFSASQKSQGPSLVKDIGLQLENTQLDRGLKTYYLVR